jgi:hypothetical protein
MIPTIDIDFALQMAMLQVWIDLNFPEIRMNREFLQANFPTLAAYE